MNRIVEIKELKKVICAASALMAATALFACSSARQGQQGPEVEKDSWLGPVSSPGTGGALRMQKLWSRGLDGYITELSLSKQGNAVLVATLPDYDHDGGSQKNHLRYFDSDGRERWKEIMPTQVKSQAISRDGSLVIATTHEDQIVAYDAKGGKLWTAHATCMPFIIESRREIVCYHDDDAEPLVAFDVFDWNGKQKTSYPIKSDILALKVSEDERHVALALTKGVVQVLGPDYRVKWTATVPGEIVDLDVSNGADPRVAVLYSTGFGKPVKAALVKAGKVFFESAPVGRVSQIGLTSDAGSFFLYGNGEDGQYVSLSQATPSQRTLQESWHHSITNNAHYIPMMYVSTPSGGMPVAQAIVGIEQVSANGRQSRVVGLDPAGALLWSLPVSQGVGADEGAFLYAQSWAPAPAKLAIATDDRKFGLFQLTAGNSK